MAVVVPVGAQAQDAWDSIRGLYPRQNYGAQVLLEQHASQSWELPQRIKTMPINGGPGTAGVYPNAGTGGGAVVERNLKGPGPGGEIIDVKVRTIHPRVKILDRLIQSIPIVGTAVAVGLTIRDIIDAARVTEGPGGTILMDPGAPEVMLDQWCYTGSQWSETCGATYAEAVTTMADEMTESCLGCYTSGGSVITVVYAPGTCSGSGTSVSCWIQKQSTVTPSNGNPSTGPMSNWQQFQLVQGQGLMCPQGQVPSFWADDWCTTPVDNWEVVDEAAARERVEPKIAPGADPQVLKDLDQIGEPVAGELPTVSGPAEIHTGRETTVNPDGSTTVKDTSSPISYGPQPGTTGELQPGWEWGERTEVRTYPPGAEIPPPGGHTEPPGTVTETEPGSKLEDLITCGLPWTPPCKINEDGTPPPVPPTIFGDPGAEGMDPLRNIIADPQVADTSWTWAFTLPTGCTAFATPAFAPYIESIDVCQFQPEIHDLMSMVWIGAAIWACVGMVGRTLITE